MEIEYKELLTITPQHSYYSGGVSEDFKYLFSNETKSLFANGRIVAKTDQGKLIVFVQTQSGNLIGDITGKQLVIGLALNNPLFYNFTMVPVDSGIPLYSNHAAPGVFGPPVSNQLVDQRFVHKISLPTRPVTLQLMHQGEELEAHTFLSVDAVSEFNFLLKHEDIGSLKVRETYATETIEHHYFSSGLARSAVSTLVRVTLENTFLADPPRFNLDFAAKSEILNYYIVARNYGSDFNQIDISGFDNKIPETPVPIAFSKVTSGNFTVNHLSKEKLGVTGADTNLVLFHSSNPVSRRDKPNMNIQLSKNGETIIPKLPLSSPDRISADFIVHLSKPKT